MSQKTAVPSEMSSSSATSPSSERCTCDVVTVRSMEASPENGSVAPLAIDLYCGLGGWAEGLLAEGWDVIGFDIERHRYPKYERPDHLDDGGQKSPIGSNPGGSLWRERSATGPRDMAMKAMRESGPSVGWIEYPGLLAIQDVRTLHGSQFRNADLIVASPPCQAYSYRAMPWKRAKALPPPDNALFEACFRIQREACGAAGRHIPLIVENVRGAQKWVGRARFNYGSFYLWGDVPALMPIGKHRKQLGDPSWFYDNYANSARRFSSKSKERKQWSAMIAKIPLPLSRHIARQFHPSAPQADDAPSHPDGCITAAGPDRPPSGLAASTPGAAMARTPAVEVVT